MEITQIVGLILLPGGLILMLGCAIYFFRREFGNLRSASAHSSEFPENLKNNRAKILVWLVLFSIIAAGAYLRFDDLADKTLSHPEAYVPGINLPEGISDPPPRTEIVSVLSYHLFNEPHPPGYYFLMFLWTKLFGTGIEAMRVPSVLFGLASIFLIFQLGKELFNQNIALIGAALMAFNGHQIYWSQNARMYTMTCFLGLLSAILLLRLLRNPDGAAHIYWGAAYVLVTILGVYTEILFWAFLAGQLCFVLLRESGAYPSKYILRLQTIVVITGAPMWAHALYTGRNSPLAPLTAAFFEEFISFGFLFERDVFSQPIREIGSPSLALLAGAAGICIAAALIRGRGAAQISSKSEVEDLTAESSFSTINLLFCFTTLGSIITIIGYDLLASSRHKLILLSCFVPVAMLGFHFAVSRKVHVLQRISERLNLARFMNDSRTLLICLTLLPVALVTLVSLFNTLIGSRLFLLFTPYLLILIAAGIYNFGVRHKAFAVVLLISLVFLHTASISYYRDYPTNPADYKNLTNRMLSLSKKGDLVLVRKNSWFTTPLFYYLDAEKIKIVADNYSEAAHAPQSERIWIITFEDTPPTKAMLDAVEDYHPTVTINARYSAAILYERNSN